MVMRYKKPSFDIESWSGLDKCSSLERRLKYIAKRLLLCKEGS